MKINPALGPTKVFLEIYKIKINIMDWTQLSLKTLIPLMPQIINGNFQGFENYLDVFYDGSLGILVKPINTTGRVKGTTGEFVNVITDNLTVKRQFTNWYDNTTTADGDFVTAYNGNDVSTRLATSDPSSAAYIDSSTVVWPLEPSAYSWVDVITPYIKIDNDVSYGLQNITIGQEVALIFADPPAGAGDFIVLMDASEGGESVMTVTAADASAASIKLITVEWDASYGSKWVVKEPSDTYTIT